MKLKIVPHELHLANPWKIASSKGAASHKPSSSNSRRDTRRIGEAAPSILYGESAAGVYGFFATNGTHPVSFPSSDVPGSMAFLETLPNIPVAAKCALNLALLDGAAKRAGKPLHDFLGLGFRENHHVTSFSIGIDSPDIIRKKVLEAKFSRVANSRSATRATTKILPPCVPSRRKNRCAWTRTKAGKQKKKRCASSNGWWRTTQHSIRRTTDAANDQRRRFGVAQGAFAAANFRRRIVPHDQGHRALRRNFSWRQREARQRPAASSMARETLSCRAQSRVENDDRLHDRNERDDQRRRASRWNSRIFWTLTEIF